uniref:Flavonoid 3'-hydroxylase n=1 Tax=Anthurium andraeanum TaxID=226677 RepID=A0A060L8Y9_ANTAD|nr:flavonoid 3'-hydroxylase [Anthurium andraeanum]
MCALVLLLFCTVLVGVLVHRLLSSASSRSGRRLPLPPGPKGWPILGNLPQLGAKPHHTLAALSRAYGPLLHLRLGRVHAVVASSASVAAAFLKTHDANFSSRPPNSGAEHVAYNYQDLVFAPYGPRWRTLRKLCSVHLFCTRALEGFRHVREEEAGVLARALLGRRGSAADVGEEVNVCAANALARAVMGRRVFGGGLGRETEEFKEMVVELMRLAGVFNLGDFVTGLGWLDPQGVVARMKRLHRRYDAMLDKMIADHVAGGGEDLLSVMIRLRGQPLDDDGTTISDVEIKALLLNLFTAGTDTTSSTVEWALAELIRHPRLLAEAQREMDSVVGRGRLVSDDDLAGLPFLQAVVKETFRLHPSTPLSLPRASTGSCEVGGYHIPGGATLLVNVWAIARDPAVWPCPLEFRPERFLPGGEHTHVDVRGTDFELIPFGAGRRICAGMTMGLRMVQFLTATLVHAFDWALPEGQTPEKLDMEEAFGLTLQRAVPLQARPTPRLSPEAYGAQTR